jgi:hypothetical protein
MQVLLPYLVQQDVSSHEYGVRQQACPHILTLHMACSGGQDTTAVAKAHCMPSQ